MSSEKKVNLENFLNKINKECIENSIEILGDLLNELESNKDSRLAGISILYCEYLLESFMEEETAKLSQVLGTSDIRLLEETNDEDLNISWDILWNIKDKKYLSRTEYLKGQIFLLNNNFSDSTKYFERALKFSDTNNLNIPFLSDISQIKIHKKIAENFIFEKNFKEALEKFNFILQNFNLNDEEIENIENDILSLNEEINKNSKRKEKKTKQTETIDLTESVQNK